jgi:alkanesulfonate monooxygenase SsuD/methylene tetrahydromethanopterin reductase-like flavin-dependent oxidoreductase (luciferase family)
MEGVIDTLRKSADSHNRDFGELQIVCRSVPAIMDESPGGERTPLAGTPDEIKEDILRYDELGVSEIIFEFNFDPEMTVERMSDYMEMLAPS